MGKHSDRNNLIPPVFPALSTDRFNCRRALYSSMEPQLGSAHFHALVFHSDEISHSTTGRHRAQPLP